MNSKKSGGKVYLDSSASSQYGSSSGGPASAYTSPKVDLQIHGVADAAVKSAEDGQWEVFAKKSKNRNNNTAAKPRGASVAPPKVGSHLDVHGKNMDNNGGKGKISSNSWHTPALDPRRVAGRANMNTRPPHSGRALESTIKNPPPALAPPLQSGWQWAARRGTANTSQSRDPTGAQGSTGQDFGSNADYNQLDDESDDDELVDDSDDDILSDNYDSDVSQKSHETRKKSKWFKSFFELLDGLTTEQLNEATREWHCAACQDGPGAIDWYKGLQPLMTHAKTKGSTRMKLHRELAELLEEELLRRGTSVIPAGEAFGKWRGLRTTTTDHEIVWPPMVIIRNTTLEQDEKEKWIGMGNQELLDYFDSYQAAKARHSYGPQGHRGISVLIFESTAVGYLEAERLHKHFAEQGTDRDAWDRHRVLFYPGGKRQLYGYMATKEDLDYFNQHSQGKARLKFEVKSYQEMVVGPMKQMSEDNQQLIWLKNKVAKQKQHSKALQETMGVMTNQLRIATEENRIVRLRTKLQHEENKEEMDYMEQFFKEKMAVIHEALEEKEQAFEKALQEERAKASDNADLGSSEDRKHRREEIVRFIDSQSKGIEDFEKERDKLIKIHDEKKTEMKRQHYEEEVELEKEFDAALTELMVAYSPHPAQPSASS